MEGEDGGAGGGEHAADLVVAAFGEGEIGFAGGEEFEDRGGAGGVFVVELERAAGEKRDELGGQIAVEGGAVGFGDFVFGRGEAVDELGLVGEEEETGGVLVEAADGGDLRVAAAPAVGEERVDIGAFAFVVGADETEGFVEEEKKAVGVIERLAVDEDVGGRGFLGDVAGRFAAERDGTGGDPVAGFAAGAVAEAGEELVEAAHFGGRIGWAQKGAGGAKRKAGFVARETRERSRKEADDRRGGERCGAEARGLRRWRDGVLEFAFVRDWLGGGGAVDVGAGAGWGAVADRGGGGRIWAWAGAGGGGDRIGSLVAARRE